MKKIALVLVCMTVTFCGLDLYSQDQKEKAEEIKTEKTEDCKNEKSADSEKSEDISRIIIGEWSLTPNQRILEGSIVFKKDGSYEMKEKLHDGTGVGNKGEYRLFTDKKPARIKLCLDRCDKPGGEWTTSFGIIRVLSDGKLEIFNSPDGKFPAAFPEGQEASEYSMVLARLQ